MATSMNGSESAGDNNASGRRNVALITGITGQVIPVYYVI